MSSDSSQRIQGIAAKVKRAWEHGKDLIDAINSDRGVDRVRIRPEPNDETATEFRFRAEIGEMPDLFNWGARAADCFQNLRAALDHAVWHFAIKGSGQDPPPNPGSVAFPIFDSYDAFYAVDKRGRPQHGSGLRKIASVKPGPVRALIEAVQPHKRRHFPKIEPLWLLRQLSNTDKHRIVTPAILMPPDFMEHARFHFSPDAGEVGSILSREPIKDGAVVLTITTEHPPTEIRMMGTANLDVSFDLTAVDGLPDETIRVDYAIHHVRDEVQRILMEFERYLV